MKPGDNIVPKWAFLVLLLSFLLFGVAPANVNDGPLYLDAGAPVADRVKDLRTTTLTVNQKISLEAK